MRAHALFIVALCGGCGPDTGGPGWPHPDPLAGLQSIRVEPASASLLVDGAAPQTASFAAIGHFADGHELDLTSRTVFSVADARLGYFGGPVFTSRPNLGGVTTVFATCVGKTSTAALSMVLQRSVTDAASPGVPADAATKFSGADAPGRAPSLVYPADGVLLPPNLGKLEIHFLPGANNTLFELAFDNPVTRVKVYMRCPTPVAGGCIYLPDAAVWSWIAETNRGGSSVKLTLRGTDDAGTSVGTAAPLSIDFSQDDVLGGLYYWTTSNGTGIMRFDFASRTQTQAEKFLGTELTGGTCVGCHALSRDGKKMVAEAGGQGDGRVLLLDVARKAPLVTFAAPGKSIFESWDPFGTSYVGVYGDRGATDWNLQLFDGNTGALHGAIANTGTALHPADHPDWSPDGTRIAFVKVGTPNTCQRMWGGSIQMVEKGERGWDAPTEIVPATPGVNRYYPAFSPDGTFVLYDESTCPGGDLTSRDCNGDTDPSATLWAIAETAGKPVLLAAANAPGLMDAGNTHLTNSFPKWSPFITQRGGENGARLEWVTFSSTRRFGLRSPPPGGSENPSGTLLWMAAVDPDRVGDGKDPSHPAFALPFQDLTTSNHIAQWAAAVVPGIQ